MILLERRLLVSNHMCCSLVSLSLIVLLSQRICEFILLSSSPKLNLVSMSALTMPNFL